MKMKDLFRSSRSRYRINEAKRNKYEFFCKLGETNFYNEPDDCIFVTFTAPDDFHAYVMVFMYVHEHLGFDQGSEYNLYDEDEFEKCVKDLEKSYNAEITADWIKKQLAPFQLSRSRGNSYAELYYIKRNGRIIDKFDDVPDFFKKSKVKAEIEREEYD